MANKIKRLRIFAGPNGSGKSTLYDYLVRTNYSTPYYHINPDYIFQELRVVLNLSVAIADFIRQKMLFSGSSFSFETVFSHSSKVNFIQFNDYLLKNYE